MRRMGQGEEEEQETHAYCDVSQAIAVLTGFLLVLAGIPLRSRTKGGARKLLGWSHAPSGSHTHFVVLAS